MEKRSVVVAFPREKRLFRFALALSHFLKAQCEAFPGIQEAPFFLGKQVASCLLPRVFARPFLFVAEDHAFTGGMVAGILRKLSSPLYLLVLDAHLDLFASPSVSFPIHRGNFLTYLLRREGFPEERLCVCSSVEDLDDLEARWSPSSPGLLYLSWDVDFGLPEVAYFPGKTPCTSLEACFARLAHVLRKWGFRFFGGDLVEFDPRKMRDPLGIARRISRCLLLLFSREGEP